MVARLMQISLSTLQNVILSGGNVSGGYAYPPPEPFHQARRMSVGVILEFEVARKASSRSVFKA